MGRQSHLARLALVRHFVHVHVVVSLPRRFVAVLGPNSSADIVFQGRSPFGPPLEDETGEFILGPNVQHDTGRDYIQDFDSRGHPRNIASHISRRRLLRAQNEALSTVGVVVRKAKESRSHWQTLDFSDKSHLIYQENLAGILLALLERVVQNVSSHWILNFRRRVVVSGTWLKASPLLMSQDLQILSGYAHITNGNL